MWPKMLLEFLPHLTRLIPAADRYFSSRSESDKLHDAALASMSEQLRTGLAGITDEQAAIRRELLGHAAASAQIAEDASRARLAVEALESRLTTLDARLTTATRLLWAVLALLMSGGVAAAVHALR